MALQGLCEPGARRILTSEIAKSGGPMPRISEVSRTAAIPADASAVWQKLCEPCSILQWNPRIAACRTETDGQGRIVRHYTLAAEAEPAPTMVETELDRRDAIMAITYKVEIVGLPVTDYVAQISVTPAEVGAEVSIRCRFVDVAYPAFDATALVGQFHETGLDGLQALMQS